MKMSFLHRIRRWAITLFIILAWTAPAAPCLAQRGPTGPRMLGIPGMMSPALTFVIASLIFFTIIALIMVIIRLRKKDEQPETPSDTALKILRERYAKGEITKEQFQSMKRDLTE